MARLHFRLTSIALDEEEDPRELTAVVDRSAFMAIAGILGHVRTAETSRSGTEMTITLPITEASMLFRKCGSTPGYDKAGHEIYDSLTMVFYGLMGE